jgi:hypothetical protein
VDKKTPTPGITMSVISSATNVVSPAVTAYTPDAFINVDSSISQVVTITGIDKEFTLVLDICNSAMLMNSFTVSGFFG